MRLIIYIAPTRPECDCQTSQAKAEQVDDKSRFNDDKLLWLDMDIPSSLLEKAGPPENIDGAVTLKQAEGHFYLLRHQFSTGPTLSVLVTLPTINMF